MVIIIKDLNQLTKFTKDFREAIQSFEIVLPEVAAKDIQKGIRKRAPNNFTGSLRNTQVKKYGKNRIQLTGPAHWYYVNKGIHPHKLIPIEAAEQHFQNPGSTVDKK